MKKIYFLLASIAGIITNTSAQISSDMEVIMTNPPEGSAVFNIPCDDSFDFTFLVINHGPGTIGTTDSLQFVTSLNQQNYGFTAWLNNPVATNDSFGFSQRIKRSQLESMVIPNTNPVQFTYDAPFADGNYGLYVLVAFKDTTIINDPDPSNNGSVAPVKIDCGTGISFSGADRQQLKIYPNPASGEVHFRVTMANGNATARITDISGRMVMVKDFGRQASGDKELHLDISELTEGMYYIELINGDKRSISKLSVQR